MDNSTRPFDLKLLDFESRRKQKRQRLIRRSLVPVGAVLLISTIIGLPTVLTTSANQSYSKKQYSKSASMLAPISLINFSHQEIYYFNHATSLSQTSQYDRSISEFQSALAYSNDKDFTCQIINNLVLTAENAGLQAISTSRLSNAVNYLTKALSNTTAHLSCFKDKTIVNRLTEELTVAQTKNEASAGNSNNKASAPPDQSQQDKLQQVQQQGAQNRKDDQIKSYGSDNYDSSYKHW